MRYKIYIVVLIFCISLSVSAQERSDFSLAQAIEYALEHQPDILNARLDESIAQSKVSEITGMGLPQLSGNFDIKDFEKIPTTTFPDFISPAVYNVLFDENVIPRRDLDPIRQIPVQFGTRWNATASLNASQLVFNPAYLVGVQASRVFRELAQKNVQRSRVEVQVAVSKAYYAVLVNSERMKLLDANSTRIKKLRDDTEAMFKNGFVERIDLNRITLAYNNLNTEREKTTRLMGLAVYLLKFQMGMNQEADLRLTDKLNPEAIKAVQLTEGRPNGKNRIEYSILTTQQRMYQMDLKRYKVAYYPTIAAYGAVSANALREEFDIFDSDKKWYPSVLIGASLSLNIFDGAQRESRIRQARLNLRKLDNDLFKAESGFTLEATSAQTILQNALASFNSQTENLELATDIVRVAKVKYDQGVGSNLEVVNAETSFREAETNYYNSMYEVLVARVELDKALGNLK